MRRRLPVWMQSFLPNIFYIEEKSWNYYPYTTTGRLTNFHFIQFYDFSFNFCPTIKKEYSVCVFASTGNCLLRLKSI